MSDKILSMIGKELPTVEVSSMVLGKTSIDVEVVAHDQLDKNLNGTWFNNSKLGNLLKLVVVISKDSSVTEILSLGIDAVSLCDKTIGKLERISLADEVIRLTKPGILGSSRAMTRERNRILSLIDNNVEVRILNLSKDFKGSVKDIIRSEKIEIEDTEITKIYYDTRFALEETEEHVSIFSYVKMDIRDFEETFGIETSKSGLDSFNGSVALERVITSGKPIRRSRAFYKNGRPHRGSVSYSPSNGRYLTENGELLVTTTIRNPKIRDEREIMSIREIQTEFRDLSLAVSSKNITRDNMQQTAKTKFLDLFMSTKDEEDNIRFSFQADPSGLLETSSVYGPLLRNLSFRKRRELLERTLIKSLEVRRIRVKAASHSFNKMGTQTTNAEVFDKNEPPILLIRTGEDTPGEIREVNNSQAAFSELDIYLPKRKQSTRRHFTGTDKTFSNITDGFYQYEVQIEVTDTIQPYLLEQVAELRNVMRILNEYYQFSVLTSPSLEKMEILNPHIDLQTESTGTELPEKSHYEAYSNKFTRRFSKVAKNRYKNPEDYPWISTPPVILDLVSGFTSNFPEDRKSQIASSMSYSISPITGNPSNILSLIKMVESFTKKIEDLASLPIKPTTSAIGSNSATNKPVDGKRANPKTFSTSRRFNGFFDANMTKKFGFNYFDVNVGDEQDLGLKVINNVEFDSRVEEENEKFFSDKDVDINPVLGSKNLISDDSIGKSSHTFLTPVSFIDSDVVYDFHDVVGFPPTARNLRRKPVSVQNKLNTFSLLMERIVTDSLAKDIAERNSILSSDYSLSITEAGEPRIDMSLYSPQDKSYSTPMLKVLQTTNFYDYLTSLKSDQLPEIGNYLPYQNRWRKDRKINRFFKDNSLKNPFRMARIVSRGISRSKIFSRTFSKRTLRSFAQRSRNTFSIINLEGQPRVYNSSLWKSLPNQIKSIFLRKSDNSSDKVTGEFLEDMFRNFSSIGSLEYKFTVGKIAMIQYYSGNGWTNLTKRVYDQLSGKKLLCRIKNYKNSKIGYRQTPSFDLNVYNNCFILDIQREVVFERDELIFDDFGERISEGGGASDSPGLDQLGNQGFSKQDTDVDYSKLTPKELESFIRSGGANKISDEDIENMNALQLGSIPDDRKQALSRSSSKVSRGNMVCNLISDQREADENRDVSPKTGVVPNRGLRDTDKKGQSGDVY